jgi:hypothetical protein
MCRRQGRFEAGRILLRKRHRGWQNLRTNSSPFPQAGTTIRSTRLCYFWIGFLKMSLTFTQSSSRSFPLHALT